MTKPFRFIFAFLIILCLVAAAQARAYLLLGGTAGPSLPVHVAWTGHVQGTSGGAVTSMVSTRNSGTIAAGDCVFVTVNDNSSGQSNGSYHRIVTDNASPSHVFYSTGPQGVNATPTIEPPLVVYYLLNASAGGNTITVSDSDGNIQGIQVDEYSNCGSYLDPGVATGAGNQSSTNGTALALPAGALTTTVKNDFVFAAGLVDSSSRSLAPAAGYTGVSAAPTSTGTLATSGTYSAGTNHFFLETEQRTSLAPTGTAVTSTFTGGSTGAWWTVALAVTPPGYSPPVLTLVQTPTVGANHAYLPANGGTPVSVGGNGQQCVFSMPAVRAGDTIVGYSHGANQADSMAMAPDYVIDNAGNYYSIAGFASWLPWPENTTVFYAINVQGNPTSISVDFPYPNFGDTINGGCNIGIAEYTGASGVLVSGPVQFPNTTAPSISVAPTSAARIWAYAADEGGHGAQITSSGYYQANDSWSADGIGTWQSGSAALTGAQNVAVNAPLGVSGTGGGSCTGVGGTYTPGCPTVLAAAAVQTTPVVTPVHVAWLGNSAKAAPGASSMTATRSHGTIGAGNCVVVSMAAQFGDTITVSDNGTGHSYVLGPHSDLQLMYTLLNAAAGGNTVTVADSTGPNIWNVQVDEWQNCGTALDGAGRANTGTGTTATSGSLTTTQNGDLIVGVCETSGQATQINPETSPAWFQGWEAARNTTIVNIPSGPFDGPFWSGDTGALFYYAYNFLTQSYIQPSAGAVSADCALSGSDSWWAAVVAIQPPATGPPTISGVALSNGTSFVAPAGANTTIDTLSANCSSGSCAGASFALATTGSCSGATSNGSFAISGSELRAGASTVNAGTYPIGIAVTLAGATNSGICYPFTLTGQVATVTAINLSGTSYVQSTAGTVGTATATMSNGGIFSGTWSLQTSGTDNSAHTCNNLTGIFAINSSTGVVTNTTSATASNYSGLCIVANY